jgi:hypothetical protein
LTVGYCGVESCLGIYPLSKKGENMAKTKTKVQVYGRQISKMKDETRAELGEGATPEALATKAQEKADALGWDYLFTVASFTEKAKGKPKAARQPRQPRATKAAPAANGGLTIEDVQAVKGLVGKLGSDTVRRLLDVVGP